MTTSRLGTLGNISAPVEVTITVSSTSTPGRPAGSDPVAMTMCLASWVSSPTFTLPAAGIDAQPLIQVTLFFLNRNSIPDVLPLMVSSL